MITVKSAATGSRDRPRYNTSATSTSDREAYDGNQGWGGSISCGCSHLSLLTKEASLNQFEHQLSFLALINRNTTFGTRNERQLPPHDTRTAPISVRLRRALRQASAQQCCHRSCDEVPASRRAGHFYCVSSTQATHEQAFIPIRSSPVADPKGRTLSHITPITKPSYQGSLPSIAY